MSHSPNNPGSHSFLTQDVATALVEMGNNNSAPNNSFDFSSTHHGQSNSNQHSFSTYNNSNHTYHHHHNTRSRTTTRNNNTVIENPYNNNNNNNNEDFSLTNAQSTTNALNSLFCSFKNGTSGSTLSMEKRLDLAKLEVNTKKYCDQKESTFRRFLVTVEKHCGPELASWATHYFTNDYGEVQNKLIHMLSGEKELPQKITILNECLLACTQNWKCLKAVNKASSRPKKKNDPYEPCTWDTYLSNISSSLKSRGVQMSLLSEQFRKKGSFIADLQHQWELEMLKDPFFGSKSYGSTFDPKSLEKVRDAIQNNALDIENNATHALELLIWSLGVFWWLRGSTELLNRKWSEVSFGRVDGSHQRCCNIRVNQAQQKHNHRKVGNPTDIGLLRPIEVRSFNEDDVFCPVAAMEKWKEFCPKHKSKKLLICPVKGIPLSTNCISKWVRSFATRCGFDNATTNIPNESNE